MGASTASAAAGQESGPGHEHQGASNYNAFGDGVGCGGGTLTHHCAKQVHVVAVVDDFALAVGCCPEFSLKKSLQTPKG